MDEPSDEGATFGTPSGAPAPDARTAGAGPPPPGPARRLLPPHALVLALALQFLLDGSGTAAALTSAVLPMPVRALGLLPLLAGCALALHAAGRFRRVGTGVVPFSEATALVTDGAFSRTRNPMYLSLVAILVGTALLFGTLLPALVPPLFAYWLRRRFIDPEEQFMAARFPDDYERYRARVRRWF